MMKDIKPLNNKGEPHGLWEVNWGGTLMYKYFFHNDKKVGYGEDYEYLSDKLKEKKYNI